MPSCESARWLGVGSMGLNAYDGTATTGRERPVYPENAVMPVHRAAGLSVRLSFGSCLGAAILLAGFGLHPVDAKPFMIVGLDEKILWDADGKPVLAPDGKDAVLIVDLANPETPKIAASLPLKNSVVGPPVNVDIDPTGSIALVADSVDIVKDGDALKQVPDNKIYVIDLKASPPRLAATLTAASSRRG